MCLLNVYEGLTYWGLGVFLHRVFEPRWTRPAACLLSGRSSWSAWMLNEGLMARCWRTKQPLWNGCCSLSLLPADLLCSLFLFQWSLLFVSGAFQNQHLSFFFFCHSELNDCHRTPPSHQLLFNSYWESRVCSWGWGGDKDITIVDPEHLWTCFLS